MKEFFKNLNVLKALSGEDNGLKFILALFSLGFLFMTFPLIFGMSENGYKMFAIITFWMLSFTYVINTKNKKEEK